MIGKALIAAGVALALVGGVIFAAITTGTQMARGGYSPSVQHYAEQNASVGDPLAFAIIGLGVVLALAGVALTLLRRRT